MRTGSGFFDQKYFACKIFCLTFTDMFKSLCALNNFGIKFVSFPKLGICQKKSEEFWNKLCNFSKVEDLSEKAGQILKKSLIFRKTHPYLEEACCYVVVTAGKLLVLLSDPSILLRY